MNARHQKTAERVEALHRCWRGEYTSSLSHYFCFTIVDPRATGFLLAANFSIMEKGIAERGVDCKKDYRNIIWYRGPKSPSVRERYRLTD